MPRDPKPTIPLIPYALSEEFSDLALLEELDANVVILEDVSNEAPDFPTALWNPASHLRVVHVRKHQDKASR